MRSTPIIDFALSFWRRVDKSGGESACWPWMDALDKDGYGHVRIGEPKLRAHRVAFTLAHGTPIDGMMVRHSCDNPACCNPRHLLAGTHDDNMRDRSERGRQASGERNGRAKLSWEKVHAMRSSRSRGMTARQVARLYAVNIHIVRDVLAVRTWKPVAGQLFQ